MPGSNFEGPRRGRISEQDWGELQQYRAWLDEEKARTERLAAAAQEAIARPPKLYAYLRCSHEESKKSGLSIESQKTSCGPAIARLRELHPDLPEVEWVIDEAVSAWKSDKLLRLRPRGAILHYGLRPGDHVVFAYLDRGWRNTEDCLTTLRLWKERGVVVHFADFNIDSNTWIGELLIRIIAAVAEMRSSIASERLKAICQEFRKQGRPANGHAPLGFRLIGPRGHRKAVPDAAQRKVMAEIVRIRDKYDWSWQIIEEYIEHWYAENEGRKPKFPWERRLWSHYRCRIGYHAEKKLQLQANGGGTTAKLIRFGYRASTASPGALEPDEAEQTIITQIKALAATGKGETAICQALDMEGVPRRDKTWKNAHGLIRSILQRNGV
jgi:DNA invertase Pin-like site-specific DNA recombinase